MSQVHKVHLMSKVGGAGHEEQDQESPPFEDAHDEWPADNVVGQYKHHPGQHPGKNTFRLRSALFSIIGTIFISWLWQLAWFIFREISKWEAKNCGPYRFCTGSQDYIGEGVGGM